MCDCRISMRTPIASIVYCPLHEAAEGMREVLKRIVEEGTKTASDPLHNYNIDMVDRIAREAIYLDKAEGK